MIICDVGNKKKTCILKRMSFFYCSYWRIVFSFKLYRLNRLYRMSGLNKLSDCPDYRPDITSCRQSFLLPVWQSL